MPKAKNISRILEAGHRFRYWHLRRALGVLFRVWGVKVYRVQGKLWRLRVQNFAWVFCKTVLAVGWLRLSCRPSLFGIFMGLDRYSPKVRGSVRTYWVFDLILRCVSTQLANVRKDAQQGPSLSQDLLSQKLPCEVTGVRWRHHRVHQEALPGSLILALCWVVAWSAPAQQKKSTNASLLDVTLRMGHVAMKLHILREQHICQA